MNHHGVVFDTAGFFLFGFLFSIPMYVAYHDATASVAMQCFDLRLDETQIRLHEEILVA